MTLNRRRISLLVVNGVQKCLRFKSILIILLLMSVMLLTSCSSSPTATPLPVDTDESATCTLSGGGLVKTGWSGKDTASNYCNRCKCMDFGLACTKMACPTTPIVPWPFTPTPTLTMSPAGTPRQ